MKPLSDRARQTMQYAIQNAYNCDIYSHDNRSVRTLDVLIGLLKKQNNVIDILKSMSVNIDELKDKAIRAKGSINVWKDKSIGHSEEEAANYDYINTEHLLLGILRERDAIAEILIECGVTEERVKSMLQSNVLTIQELKHALDMATRDKMYEDIYFKVCEALRIDDIMYYALRGSANKYFKINYYDMIMNATDIHQLLNPHDWRYPGEPFPHHMLCTKCNATVHESEAESYGCKVRRIK